MVDLEARPCPPDPPAPSTPVGPGRSWLACRVGSKPGQAPPPPTVTAARPAPRSPPVPSGALHACHTNFACNSLVTISNVEFIALKSQRFQTLLNLHPIELHATFGEAQAPPPPTVTAARPAPRSPPVPSGALHACHTNFACNSLVTISNVEFIALKSQRFQTLLNLHPIELHATFGEAQDPPPPTGTAAAYGYRIWVL